MRKFERFVWRLAIPENSGKVFFGIPKKDWLDFFLTFFLLFLIVVYKTKLLLSL